MDEGAVYKQVVVQIKAEFDSSFEKTFTRIGAMTDSAAKDISNKIGSVLANLEAAVNRLELASSRLGSGVGAGFGGGGGGIGGGPIGGGGGRSGGGASVGPSTILPGSGGRRVPGPDIGPMDWTAFDASFAAQNADIDARLARMRGGGAGGGGQLAALMGSGLGAGMVTGIGMGMAGAVGMAGMGLNAVYRDSGLYSQMRERMGFQNGFFADERLSANGMSWLQQTMVGANPIQQAMGFGNMRGGGGLVGSYAGVDRAQQGLSMQQRASSIDALRTATQQSIGDFRGNMNYRRNIALSDGTLQGQLDATRKSLGTAENDEQRLQLRQSELELTRQITQEQTRGAQQAIQGLEREKAAVQELLDRRKALTGSAGASFGYADREDRQAALRAAEKFSSGQGAAVSEQELAAFQTFGLKYGTERAREMYEGEGRRRGGADVKRFEDLLGVQREMERLRDRERAAGEGIVGKEKELFDLEQKQKKIDAELGPIIDKLVDAVIAAFVKRANERLRTEESKVAQEAQTVAAGRTRRGLTVA